MTVGTMTSFAWNPFARRRAPALAVWTLAAGLGLVLAFPGSAGGEDELPSQVPVQGPLVVSPPSEHPFRAGGIGRSPDTHLSSPTTSP